MEHLESQLQADRLNVHRSNLLSALRLSVQSIVDHACFDVVDDDCEAYQQLCITMEHILMLGYRGPRTMKSAVDRPNQFWHIIQSCLKHTRAVQTVHEMDGVKSKIGKCRAWIVTCLVQKSMAQDFKKIMQHDKILAACYDGTSVLRQESSCLVSGLLVALESIDFSVCLRGNPRLDSDIRPVINYGIFMHAKRCFAGQLSDEDELRRSRMEVVDTNHETPTDDAMIKIADEGEDDVDGDTAMLGDGAAANLTGASLGTVPAELLARKSSGYSSLSSASMPLAAHSTVTMDGSRQFITIQRQLTKERNQRRYFEDMLKTKNLEAVKAAHEIEALVNNLEATKAEAQEEREAMQNVILELNEKLCAQDRVLTSLLSRYEDREGTINADLREAVEMLNSRDESNPGAGSHASPVRNVKIILNRLGKSLTSARPTELQPVSIDDEELVDLATELQDLSPLSSPGSPDVATSDSTANSPCLDVCDEGKQDNADDLVDPGIETNPSEPSSGSEFGS